MIQLFNYFNIYTSSPLQLDYFHGELLHFLLQLLLFHAEAARDGPASGVGQLGVEVFTLLD